MSKSFNLDERHVFFNLYDDQWVFTSSGSWPGGFTIDLPPVRIFPRGDINAFKKVVLELISEGIRTVPPPDLNSPTVAVGLRAQSFGLKSWKAFATRARAFNLVVNRDGFRVEEWRRTGVSHVAANPLWKRKFDRGDLDMMIAYVIHQTNGSMELERSNKHATRPRRNKRPSNKKVV